MSKSADYDFVLEPSPYLNGVAHKSIINIVSMDTAGESDVVMRVEPDLNLSPAI